MLRRTVLIIARSNEPYFNELCAAMVNSGMQVLTVHNLQQALERLSHELFVSIVVDEGAATNLASLVNRLQTHPSAAITPLLLLVENAGKQDIFGGRKTLFDQSFVRRQTPVKAVCEFLQETVKGLKNNEKRGDLSRVAVPFVFTAAQYFGLNGALACEREKERRLVYFENGQVVFASSSNPDEVFGQFLCDQGFVSETQRQQALNHAKQKKLRLGQALVEMQLVKPDLLIPLLREHIKHVVLQTLSWDGGSYQILVGEKADAEAAIFKLPISQCVYDGVRTGYNEARLRGFFGDLSQVKIFPNNTLAAHLKEVPLEPKERNFATLLGGGKTLQELIDKSGLSARLVMQLCFIFLAFDACRVSKPNDATRPILNTSINKAPEAAVLAPPSMPPREIPRPGWQYFTGGAAGMFLMLAILFLLWISGKEPANTLLLWQARVEELLERLNPKPETVQPYRLSSKPAEAPPAVVAPLVVTPLVVTPPVVTTATQSPAEKPTPTAPVPPVAKAPATKPAPPKPNLAELISRGKLAYDNGSLQEAAKYFNQVIQNEPRHGEALVGLAAVMFDQDNEAQGNWYLQRALQVAPQNAEAHLLLGNQLQLKNQGKQALAEYELFLQYSKDESRKREVRKVVEQLKQQVP